MRPRAVHVVFALFGLVALLPAPASAGELRFEPMPGGEQLSHRSVHALAEDRDGFLWIGTMDGLNRYDGYGITVFRPKPDDPRALPSGIINALFNDRSGRLWIGTQGGLCRYDGQGGFVRYDLAGAAGTPIVAAAPRRALVHTLGETRAGLLWVGTGGGLLRYEPETDRFLAAPGEMGTEDIRALEEDEGGRLWVLAYPRPPRPARVFRLDSMGASLETLPLGGTGPIPWTFHRTLDGEFWLTSKRPVPPTARGLSFPAGTVPANELWTRLVDRRGWLWLGGPQGLFLERDAAGAVLQAGSGFAASWLHRTVLALHEDRSGTVWIGTLAGVLRWDPHAQPFQSHRHREGDPTSLSSSAISALAPGAGPGADDSLWVGTYGGGLNRWRPSAGAVSEHYRHRPGDRTSLRDDLVWSLYSEPGGRLWVGTERGLCSLDPGSRRFTWHDLTAGKLYARVLRIAPGSRGQLWVSTLSGLYRYDPTSGVVGAFPFTGDARGPSAGAANALLVDGEDLWLGAEGGQLNRFDPATRRFDWLGAPGEPVTPPVIEGGGQRRDIYDLYRDGAGDLWLATTDGLARFNPRSRAFSQWGVREGLPGSAVFSIRGDGAGRLWLGTNQGLSRFDPRAPAGRQFRNFDLADGLGTTEFNRGAALVSAGEDFIFGGIDGLTSFRPGEVLDNPYRPPVVLTSIEVSNRERTVSHPPRALARLELSHRDTTVAFEFAALAFTNPGRNRYAYQLEGFDAGWIEAGSERRVRYTSLPPGRYTFRFRGSNNDGVWNEVGGMLPVLVTPPYWETWWFRLLAAALLAAAGALAYRRRVLRLLEIERLRLRIAGDLHDDLSSDLSGIATLADLLRRRPTIAGADRAQLGDVRDAALRMADALREIVWTINPEHDNLEAIVRRMRDLARRLLPDQELHFDLAAGDLPALVGMELRRDLLLIYKEALHNIARHAHALRVEIRVRVDRDRLVLSIADDGVGFDTEVGSGGHGLGSMRRRAGRLGGTLAVDTRPGDGCRLELSVELPRTRDGARRQGN